MIALFEFPSSKLISAHYDPWLLLECDTVSSGILIKKTVENIQIQSATYYY